MLAEALDKVTERRSKTREKGLADSCALLKQYYLPDTLARNIETIKEAIQNSLRRGGSQEAKNALQLLTAVTISCGEPDDMFTTFFPALSTYARNTSKPAVVRAEACFTLGMLCFIGCEDTQQEAKCSGLFAQLFTSQATSSNSSGSGTHSDDVVVQALTAWGLLATTKAVQTLATALYTSTVPLLMPLLDSKSVEVRLATGEAIALLYAARHALEEAGEFEDSDNDCEIDVDAVIGSIEDLASDGKRSRGKSERKKQRSLFREVLRTIEDNHVPHESVTVDGTKHRFEGWDIVLQLESFRRCLQSGLTLHMTENQLLQDIFGVEADDLEASFSRVQLDRDRTERAKTIHHQRQKARRNKRLSRNVV